MVLIFKEREEVERNGSQLFITKRTGPDLASSFSTLNASMQLLYHGLGTTVWALNGRRCGSV